MTALRAILSPLRSRTARRGFSRTLDALGTGLLRSVEPPAVRLDPAPRDLHRR